MKIYFDQNVLGWLASANSNAVQPLKKDGRIYVYSRASLEEISRCDNSDQYLALLKGLDAQYIELIMDGGKFTDKAHFLILNPTEAYDNYVNSIDSDYGMSSILGRLAFKLTGGKTAESFDDLSEDLVKAVENLSEEICSNISELFIEKIMDLSMGDVDIVLGAFKRHMGGIQKDFRQVLSEHIQDEDNFEGIMDVRKFYNSDKSGFSDIEPPNVLEKIWNRIEESGRLDEYNITREQFLGLVPYGDIKGDEFTVPEKICGCYGMLNWVGYWPDKRIRTEEGFTSSSRDTDHAVFAAYCNRFITADQRLAMKARAIYEHLNIGCQVVLLKFSFTDEKSQT